MQLKAFRLSYLYLLLLSQSVITVIGQEHLSKQEIKAKLIESAIIVRDQLLYDVDSLQSLIDEGLEPYERAGVGNHINLLKRQSAWWYYTGLLEEKYPFKIIVDSTLVDELTFYQIKTTDRIAEVGAGMGNFAILINLLYPNNELYINEIGAFQTMALTKGFDHYMDTSNVSIIEGTTRSTMLPKYYFDKVILRNSFHHMSRKKPMLKSLIANLKKEGVLYIAEGLEELGFSCSKSITKKEILKHTQKQGLQLTDSLRLGDTIIFKFEKIKSPK